MTNWCSITTIDLSNAMIGDEGEGRLATVLGHCPSLALLNLESSNRIGDEGERRLATVLGQC